jgi:predicted nucleotidyltransferase component of viral defense system
MAYTIETILAEKYETIIRRGATTTRARDFYDLYTLYRTRKSEIRPQVLKDAVLHTAEKRESLEDLADWKEILDDLRDDSSMQQLWDSYGMSNSYAAAITFGQTLETVKEISELIESL